MFWHSLVYLAVLASILPDLRLALRLLPYYHDPQLAPSVGSGYSAVLLSDGRLSGNSEQSERFPKFGESFGFNKSRRPAVYRTKRGNMPFLAITTETSGGDSPAFNCLPTEDPTGRALCPGLDKKGRYRCIEPALLCDGKRHCPQGEDENEVQQDS